MKIDWVVWIACGLFAVVATIFLFFFIVGEPISITTIFYDIEGKQVVWTFEGITNLINGIVSYIPLIIWVIVKLINLLKGD